MRLERGTVHEQLGDRPDQGVLGRLDLETEASGLGAGEGDVLGQVPPNRGCLVWIGADQPTGELDDAWTVLALRALRRHVVHRGPLPS